MPQLIGIGLARLLILRSRRRNGPCSQHTSMAG